MSTQLELFTQSEPQAQLDSEPKRQMRDPKEPLPECIEFDCQAYNDRCGCGYLWCDPPLRCTLLARAGLI